MAGHLINAADSVLIWYFLALNSFYGLLLALSIPEIWKHWKLSSTDEVSRYLSSDALPPISVLMPAYNMESSIVSSVRAQLALQYPQHEVLLINDGSTDGTLERLREAYDLYEVPPAMPKSIPTQHVRRYFRARKAAGLMVVDKENGGKADALNAGLNAARYPLALAVDADTMVEPDALLRLARVFLSGRPVVAAGGTIRIANGCRVQDAQVVEARLPRQSLPLVQVPEYLRAFLFGRLGWNRLGGNLIVSGAFGLFHRQHLLEIGGYATDNVVEDLDLVVRLHRHLREQGTPYEISFIPDPVAWTEVPSDLRTLGRQRERWHRGLILTMLRHRSMLLNPRYGTVGMVMMPFFFFGEMLAPVVELVGYLLTGFGLYFGLIDQQMALLFLAAALGYGMMLTVWAVILEEVTFRAYTRDSDFARMLLFAFLEPFGYRQLTVAWRLRSFWSVLRGRTQWGEMRRTGFQDAQDKAA
ncbi:MAG: glycosyltransferase family 2 protein [Gemmatimonadota bacterium]|nr:glycosyltransferase family 2 protein [Gemmatimonadota bacterium]